MAFLRLDVNTEYENFRTLCTLCTFSLKRAFFLRKEDDSGSIRRRTEAEKNVRVFRRRQLLRADPMLGLIKQEAAEFPGNVNETDVWRMPGKKEIFSFGK